MSDIIGFLESLGARPAASRRDYAEAVAGLSVDVAVRDALLRRDAAAVNAALGGRDAMWCAIMSPDDSPEDEPRREDPVREEPQPDADED